MVIKLKRMVKYKGNFLSTNSIIEVPDAEAILWIEDKIAVPVFVQKAAANQNDQNNGLNNSSEKENEKMPEQNLKKESEKEQVNNTVQEAAEINNQEVEDSGTDTDDDSGEVDISGFKVIEELPPVEINAGPFQIPGVDSSAIAALVKTGYPSLDSLKGATLETLMALPKIGYTKANKILEHVKGL